MRRPGSRRWQCRDRLFELDDRVLVMGVLNVTPDSFSDGGLHLDPNAALDRVATLLDEGADVIDVGAESTRPGSAPVSTGEQWARLEPVLRGLLQRADGPCVSVDTSDPEVASRALELGAHVINDVQALARPGMDRLLAESGAGAVLMHMKGTPADMQRDPRYEDPAGEVRDWLSERLRAAIAAGIAEDRLALDPGIGFGKTARHNHELIARLEALEAMERPIVVGVSRKSFLGAPLALPVERRLAPGLAAAAIAVFQGASVIRTHDVRATREAISLALELRRARSRGAPASSVSWATLEPSDRLGPHPNPPRSDS